MIDDFYFIRDKGRYVADDFSGSDYRFFINRGVLKYNNKYFTIPFSYFKRERWYYSVSRFDSRYIHKVNFIEVE